MPDPVFSLLADVNAKRLAFDALTFEASEEEADRRAAAYNAALKRLAEIGPATIEGAQALMVWLEENPDALDAEERDRMLTLVCDFVTGTAKVEKAQHALERLERPRWPH
jgi:hypothetical protein